VKPLAQGSAAAAEGGYGGTGRYRLPDGSDRFLIDAAAIEEWTGRLGGTLIDPIKTTVVHEQRAMTTWVARMGQS
jgi:tellurite methyltransferase